MLEIHPTSFAALAAEPGFAELVAAYTAECALPGLPKAPVDAAAYAALESWGVYHAFGAWVDGRLAGFLGVILQGVPHYEGQTFASVESLFVAPKQRRSGAGLALIREAEALARRRGSPVLFLSAPCGGRLDTLLPRLGYTACNTVYRKEMPHA